ncbi:MAG: hydroxymethylglutaryl-CoA synthase family protein [Polyangiaceae bacterium]|nr:hydroxymethylglutaryl-CoA synthase family protein [Polyangiaceae bacterium]
MKTRVGIEKARVYPTSLALDMNKLCAARAHDPADIRDVMMIDERAVNPPWEDPVTMAVNGANPMLSEDDRKNIDLLIVASESGVDQEKPLSTWVHRYLGLSPRCRNIEAKHACYGGTCGLQLAAAYLSSPSAGPNSKALVVTSDQSRTHFGKPWEFVMGAGSVSLLVSREPNLLEIELGKSGIYTNEVSDLTRPTSRVETGNSETSLLSYLDALENAVADYLARVGEPITYDYFKKNIYHIPFGGMTLRASRTALKQFGSFTKKQSDAIWDEKTKPSLRFARRMGGTYAASTFVALLSLVEHCEELRAGDRIGMFSYGSGSCAEFWSGLLGPAAKEVAQAAGLKALLDQRKQISVREYEDCERERVAYIDNGDYEPSTDGLGGWYDDHYRGKGYLVFRGCQEHYRQYAWS